MGEVKPQFLQRQLCEVRAAGQHGEWVMVRDSKDPAGPQLAFTAAEWVAFLRGVNAGEFDRIGAPQ